MRKESEEDYFSIYGKKLFLWVYISVDPKEGYVDIWRKGDIWHSKRRMVFGIAEKKKKRKGKKVEEESASLI